MMEYQTEREGEFLAGGGQCKKKSALKTGDRHEKFGAFQTAAVGTLREDDDQKNIEMEELADHILQAG